MSSKVIDYIRKDLENSNSEIIDKCVNAWIDLCSLVECNLTKPTNFGYDEFENDVVFFFDHGNTELVVYVLQGSLDGEINVSVKLEHGYMKATFYTEHLDGMSKMVARDIFCAFIDEDEDGE